MTRNARSQQSPELPVSRPRPVELTKIGMLVALAGSLLPVAALVSGFWLHGVAERDRALRSSLDLYGNSATAVVTGLSQTREKSPRYLVAYRYSAGGEDHQGRHAIRQSEWRRLQLGLPLTVRYLPASPARSLIAGYEPQPMFLLPMILLFLLRNPVLPP